MKKIIKKLILYYFIFVLIKSILAYFIPAPSAFSDEYIYIKLARSSFYNLEFVINNVVSYGYHPLYPIMLSPAYFFNKMIFIYPAMKVINSIISSLIIFPVFFLSKEFFNSNRSLNIAILISFLPSNFIFPSYVLAENVFYPLFLFSFYLIYKSFTSEKVIWPILAGVSVGLTYLSKINAIVLIPAIGVLFLFNLIRKKDPYVRNIVIIGLVTSLVISPWILRNYLFQGNILGGYASEASTIFNLNEFLFKYIIQFILYLGLLVLSAGILFPLSISKKIFSNKIIIFSILSLTSIFFTIAMAANHNVTATSDVPIDLPAKYLSWLAGRLIGRYIDVVLPLILILGFICIKEKVSLKKTLLFSFILLFSSQVILTPLFPVNNISTAHLGLFNYLLSYIVKFPINILIIGIMLGAIPFIFYKLKLNFQKTFSLFAIFFIVLNLLNFTLIFYNSNEFWYKGEQMQLGLWLDSYDQKISTVLFDKRDCTNVILKLNQSSICQPSGASTIMGVWLNDNIRVENPNNLEDVDFIISRHEFPYPIIKSSKDNIYIYSLKGGLL